MKAAVITGPRQVEFRHEPYPRVSDDQVLVDISTCGICTFERWVFAGQKQWYPVSPGHEVSGYIVALGAAVDGLAGSPRVGDLVTIDLLTRCGICGPCRRGNTGLCRAPQGMRLQDGTVAFGGFLETVAVPARSAYTVGAAPVRHAAMGEPIACCVHSIRRSGFKSGDRVAIVGGGLMGRLHLALTRIEGAAKIGIIDLNGERLTAAAAAGADWVATPEQAPALGGRQDVVFVTAAGGIDLAVELADVGGVIVLYSSFDEGVNATINADRAHRDEISIIGAYNQEPEDWRRAAAVIRSGVIADQLDALFTARYSFDEVGAALRLVTSEPTFRVFVEHGRG